MGHAMQVHKKAAPMSKRLLAFLAIIAVIGVVVLGGMATQNHSEKKVCADGYESVREFTQNKTMKLVCKKVEDRTDVEN